MDLHCVEPLSCSSSFIRFTWSMPTPPYSRLQRWQVWSEIPASLDATAMVLPFETGHLTQPKFGQDLLR
ncbi:MAG: hypothetical protein EXR57_06415 [Dehalococcoidia bacterium]|nr:hypothetical protein [Dehalococcoidia bacterium]